MWTRWSRYVAILAVEGSFGAALLKFGPTLLGSTGPAAVVGGGLLAVVNTLLVAWLTGPDLRAMGRVAVCLGVLAGSAIACAGACRPPDSVGWAILTLLGVFGNVEICRFATSGSDTSRPRIADAVPGEGLERREVCLASKTVLTRLVPRRPPPQAAEGRMNRTTSATPDAGRRPGCA